LRPGGDRGTTGLPNPERPLPIPVDIPVIEGEAAEAFGEELPECHPGQYELVELPDAPFLWYRLRPDHAYGEPALVRYRVRGEERRAVLHTMAPNWFGHDRRADRAALVLLAADTFDRVPRHTRVLDVGAVAREAGGSGGLRRYWLLVEKGSGATKRRTILELKETTTPGAAFGRHSKELPVATRLATLKSTFWGGSSSGDYFYVTLSGARFLVRDRATKKSVKLDPKGGKATTDVLLAQASVMARLQAKYWRAVKKDDLRAWLHDSSKTLAHRWADTYEASR